MKYRINEIFYSIQGEGKYTGTPTVFIRFSGCNMNCPFCDTDHSAYKKMNANEITKEVLRLTERSPFINVTLTGGEPAMQADEHLVNTIKFEHHGLVTVETNGTLPCPKNIDWITVSPKGDTVAQCDELKILVDCEKGIFIPKVRPLWKSYQPIWYDDVRKTRDNVNLCIQMIQEDPSWKLSLQTHKLIGIR